MNLLEYMNGKPSITEFECSVFGLGGLTKGWKKRCVTLEVTEESAAKVYEHYEDLQHTVTGKKAYTRATKALKKLRHRPNPSKKYLYVMQNSYNDLKIGISIDPLTRARQLTTSSGSTVTCVAYWDTEIPANEVESFLLKHYKAFRKEGEWFEPYSFTIKDVESMIPCKKVKVFDIEKESKDTKEVKNHADTEEYQYLHIKHETKRAFLFNILGYDIWVAKSCIKSMNKSRHMIKVRIGLISDKINVIKGEQVK